MNLEQLQSMSDEELNELSALKVMDKIYQNGKMFGKVEGTLGHRFIAPWNPTNDMNDTMELTEKFSSFEIEGSKPPKDIKCDNAYTAKIFNPKLNLAYASKLPRAITIASILAKESE